MTTEEFDEAVKNFCPEKDHLEEKVNELFAKGARTINILYFIIQNRNCLLTEAMEIVEYCPNYHKRFK
ncbi:hypothetical protein FY557_03620 [Chryseobacterium sp. SN22]|uniref:hypothetical protein n=1 Tax=Chryseobacterium sp. SN22 TaxID=2606431 RepID=UPI0011EBBE69|nr:hypothetical protein [Chryseobacterium sp. SN22]KAA0129809.1 hypothetical protein FY557_03620 [Chryseobacterium sp. SN22]